MVLVVFNEEGDEALSTPQVNFVTKKTVSSNSGGNKRDRLSERYRDRD